MEETVSAVTAAGGKAKFTALDMRDTDELTAVIAKVADDSGLDIMVNSAGLGHWGKILDGTVDQWREMLEVNVLGLLVGCWSAIAGMRRTGRGGHIVNISSIAANRPDSGVYGATKAAVNHLTAGLRQELEQDDIRITSLMPGVVATNFVRHMDPGVIQGMGAMLGVQIDIEPGERVPEEVINKAQEAMESIIAKPEDIADVVAYIVGLPRRLNIPEVIVRPAQTSSLL
jgi:NADP-dependent 3-hydroxy acid dehydrogenase YdfG